MGYLLRIDVLRCFAVVSLSLPFSCLAAFARLPLSRLRVPSIVNRLSRSCASMLQRPRTHPKHLGNRQAWSAKHSPMPSMRSLNRAKRERERLFPSASSWRDIDLPVRSSWHFIAHTACCVATVIFSIFSSCFALGRIDLPFDGFMRGTRVSGRLSHRNRSASAFSRGTWLIVRLSPPLHSVC